MDTSVLAQIQARHDRRRRVIEYAWVIGVCLVVFSACAAFAVRMTNGPDGRAAAAEVGPAGSEVTITDVSNGGGLAYAAASAGSRVAIGEPGSLRIRVSNPTAADVALVRIDVAVGAPTATGCDPAWLDVDAVDATADPIVVPADGATVVDVGFRLVDLPTVNQDACKGATFPLTISGSTRPV